MKKQIEQLEKEIKKREKHIPGETFEQGGRWNYTDILKAKLQQLQEDQEFYEKEKASWEVMFKRYERALEERKEEELKRVDRLKKEIEWIKKEISNLPTDRGKHFIQGQVLGYIIPEAEQRIKDEIFGDKK